MIVPAMSVPLSIEIWIPFLVCGRGLNDRLRWQVRAKYTKDERGRVCLAFMKHKERGSLPLGPYEVTLTRVYSGRERLYDDDNWVGAAKAARDQVAAELKVNDGDRKAIRFTYDQVKGSESGVRVVIWTRAAS